MVFIKRVIHNYDKIGAIGRSSKFLCNKMIQSIDFSQDIEVIEFGPGDGIFTDKMLKKMTQKSRITIFEIDDGFVQLLQQKYRGEHRVVIHGVSATEINNFFEKNSVDYIVSGLPLAFIEKNIVCEILEKSRDILKNEGKYVQFQYFLQNKKQIKQYFPKTNYDFTFFNIPPAFVYTCHK